MKKPSHRPAEYAALPVRITSDGDVLFGDEQLPGCIAEGGITIKPGSRDDINRMTIEFLTGPVQVDDPLADNDGA